MLSSSEDSTIKIWDLRTPTHQRNYDCGSSVNSLALHPNQGEVICGLQNGTVRIWDLGEGKFRDIVGIEGDVAVRSVAIRADGRQAAVSNNKGHVYIYKLGGDDMSVFEGVRVGGSGGMKINASKTYILKVAYSPDGKTLVSCGADNHVKLWNVGKDYGAIQTLVGHQRWVWDCAFSVDSNYLLTASSDATARLWDLQSGDTVKQYTGHRKAVSCVALSEV